MRRFGNKHRSRGCRRSIPSVVGRAQAKPAWVAKEVIRLKALMPGVGCRTLALAFNRRYAVSRGMTVGRTFVSYTVLRYRYEVEVLRRSLKHRVPLALPKNRVWGLDLTGKTDATGKLHMILGLLDHGSRGLLALAACRPKLRGLCSGICFWR